MKMKTILQKLADGGVAHYPPTAELTSLMCGEGYGWGKERIEAEAVKFGSSAGDDPDWRGFPEEFAIRWCTAIGTGGLTEDAMLDLLAERIQIRRGYQKAAIIELDDLPSEFTSSTVSEKRDALKFEQVISGIHHRLLITRKD